MRLVNTNVFYDCNGKQTMSVGENNDFCFGSDIEAVVEAPSIITKNCWIQAKKIGAFTAINEYAQIRFVESIGRFCSIAQKCEIGLPSHPVSAISTSDVFYRGVRWSGLFEDIEYEKNRQNVLDIFAEDFSVKINIGNDVWIGQGVKIVKSVDIGDGAIIAAGAVVTKDVPPYTIVGGVPAKVIKKRFSDDIITKLLELKWWDYGPTILKDIDITQVNMEQLCVIEERIKSGWPKYNGIIYRFSQKEKRVYKIENNQEYIVYDEKCDEIKHGGISGGSAIIDAETGELQISGWFLPQYAYDEIRIYNGEQFLGHARLGMVRNDVLKNYPTYGDARSGWSFSKKITEYNRLNIKCICYKNEKEVYTINNVKCKTMLVDKLLSLHRVEADGCLTFEANKEVGIIADNYDRVANVFGTLYKIVRCSDTKDVIVCTENWEKDTDRLRSEGVNAIPYWVWLICYNKMISYHKVKNVAKDMGVEFSHLLSYLKQLFKKKLTLVYGNCQIMSLNSLMVTSPTLNRKYMLIEMKPVQSIKTEEFYDGFNAKFLETIDVFIYQDVSIKNKFSEKLATDNMLIHLSEICKKVCIPNVYFAGYYPQLCPNLHNPYIEKYGNGPFPQGDKNIIELSDNYSAKEISEIIDKNDFYSVEECEECVRNSIDELKKREKKCNVIISDYIEANYKKRWLMFTPNHPSNIVLKELVERIFNYLNEVIDDIDLKASFENSAWQTFIYPSVQEKLELEFRLQEFCYWRTLKSQPSTMYEYVEDYLKYCKKTISEE